MTPVTTLATFDTGDTLHLTFDAGNCPGLQQLASGDFKPVCM